MIWNFNCSNQTCVTGESYSSSSREIFHFPFFVVRIFPSESHYKQIFVVAAIPSSCRPSWGNFSWSCSFSDPCLLATFWQCRMKTTDSAVAVFWGRQRRAQLRPSREVEQPQYGSIWRSWAEMLVKADAREAAKLSQRRTPSRAGKRPRHHGGTSRWNRTRGQNPPWVPTVKAKYRLSGQNSD